jgi:hypothetical protein
MTSCLCFVDQGWAGLYKGISEFYASDSPHHKITYIISAYGCFSPCCVHVRHRLLEHNATYGWPLRYT